MVAFKGGQGRGRLKDHACETDLSIFEELYASGLPEINV